MCAGRYKRRTGHEEPATFEILVLASMRECVESSMFAHVLKERFMESDGIRDVVSVISVTVVSWTGVNAG